VQIKTVHVAKFRKGSVEFDLVAESDSPMTAADDSQAANSLRDYLQTKDMMLNTGTGSRSSVDTPKMYIEDDSDDIVDLTSPCSVYDVYSLCSNGSVCIYPHSQPVCQCAEGYSGEWCDVARDSSNYQPMIIGLSVMSAMLFMLLVGCCVYCCYTRRDQFKSDEHRRRAYHRSAAEHSGEAPPHDSSYNTDKLNSRLTPQWTSEYTTPMYNFYDHTRPPHTLNTTS